MACTVACSDGSDDDIPPAIEPPTKPEEPGKEDEYNKPDFELHKDGEPFNSYRGLVMTGYQGWFGTPDDGCLHATKNNTKWYHYRENDMFEPGVLRNSIDFWPDMSEYEKKYPVEKFTLPGGGNPTVFSSYDESTVMLHFKWMKDYGIDGAFMQRFVGEVIDNPDGKEHFDKVLQSAMKASNTHQRAICVMYDLGGFQPDRLTKTLADAKNIMDTYQLKDRSKQKFYLYQDEKPLIVLWGVGFNDNRPFSLTDVETLMNGLKEMGYSLMLGVPTYWRERRNDALSDAKLHDLIKAADVIMPWFVGRYGKNNYSDFHNLIANDVKWCNDNGVEYAPLCFPGSSDRNMHPENGVNERYGGQFLWDQMYHCIKSGAQMLYMAMFDEIDEGTALFKCLNKKDVPSNESSVAYYVRYKDGNYKIVSKPGTDDAKYTLASDYNVTFGGIEDDLPSDHYLWLTGQGKKMLRGEIPLSGSLPVR
ncbi:glycoside hydrolase family 71/99-like protein [Bacteroides sp. 519]|uniref:glycoside hydrolase family 71/99-like protein n=1 Tax=Bacteroides sp. 519 TaxID=2302937 RepID=UPI001EF249DE|nr:glycoside hydrolase family 71/99-like protein [Bacteroides sp. 519]